MYINIPFYIATTFSDKDRNYLNRLKKVLAEKSRRGEFTMEDHEKFKEITLISAYAHRDTEIPFWKHLKKNYKNKYGEEL